jgi:ribosome-binding factor A
MARRPFHRTDRLGPEMKEVLAQVLHREAREPLVARVVVTDVEVTRDLSVARVFYDAPADLDAGAVQEALDRAAGFLRRRVGQEIRVRAVPELRFAADTSIERGRRVEAILDDLSKGRPGSGEQG